MSSSTITPYASPLLPPERRLAALLPIAVGICILIAVYAPAALAFACAVLVLLAFLNRPFQLLLTMVFLIPFNFMFIRFGKWFAIWAGILIASLFRSHDLPYTVKESVRLLSNFGLCYLVLNLVDTREKVLQVFRVLVVSSAVVACYGFYQFAIRDYGPLFWLVNPRVDTSFSHGRFTFWPWRDRMISVLTSEMELGHYFNLSLPLAVVVWLSVARDRICSKWFLVVLTILAGLVLTFTFGAWLSL